MFTQKLLKLFIKNHGDTGSIDIRTRYAVLEAWVSIIINLLLGIIKLLLGIFGNCLSLVTDAFHTLSDMITSIIVLFGARAAKKPHDLEHPYGHARVEPIATLIIAVFLIVVGVEFIHAGIDRLHNPLELKNTWLIISTMIISYTIKEWLAHFSFALGRIIKSDMLKADAWHHRTDALASIPVILAAIGSYVGYPKSDGIFALVIAGLIIWTGFSLAKGMISYLIGEAPSKELVTQILSIASSIKGVRGIHGIEIHDYGNTKICSLHIEVSPKLNTKESHGIANKVEDILKDNLGLSATVHIDIYTPGAVNQKQ